MNLTDEQWHDLEQVAFTAFLDEALGLTPGHRRAESGMRAAVEAVVNHLSYEGYVRPPLTMAQAGMLSHVEK